MLSCNENPCWTDDIWSGRSEAGSENHGRLSTGEVLWSWSVPVTFKALACTSDKHRGGAWILPGQEPELKLLMIKSSWRIRLISVTTSAWWTKPKKTFPRLWWAG